MKIGLIYSAYDSERYLKESLESWLNLKNNSQHEIIIAASDGIWEKYQEIGLDEIHDKSLDILLESNVDFLYKNRSPYVISEEESRTTLLRFLNYHNCDLLWMVDGDEVFTTQDILNIIEYIESNPQVECFRVNYKNFTIRNPLFLNDFVKATIYRGNIRGGLTKFIFDNDAVYSDGAVPDTMNTHLIPRSVVFPKHYTWLEDDDRIPKKIQHQEHKYIWSGQKGSRCQYRMAGDKLKFNENFWNNRGLQFPILRQEGSIYSHLFELNFNRKENQIDITKIQEKLFVTVKVYSITDSSFIYDTNMKLEQNVNYWIKPSLDRIFDQEDFEGFRVEVIKRGSINTPDELIHEEFLYLKV